MFEVVLRSLTNQDLQMSAIVRDIADLSLLEGVSVEFFFDSNGSNISMGSSLTDENGTANLTWAATGISPGSYQILALCG